MKSFRLGVYEILGVFINTLTGDEKYSLRNRTKLPQPIQLELSKQQKGFPNFLLDI